MDPSEKHAAVDLKGRRILVIPEFSSFGGTRTYFTYLLDYYSRRGARVTVLLSHDQVDNDIAGLLERHGCRAVIGRLRPRAGAGGLLYTFPYSLAYDIIAVLPRGSSGQNRTWWIVSDGDAGPAGGVVHCSRGGCCISCIPTRRPGRTAGCGRS